MNLLTYMNPKEEKSMAKTMRTMRDVNGNDVPVKYVKPYDKQKDRVVRRIHGRALSLRKQIEQFVALSIGDLQALSQLKENLGEKGNFTATSFDGLLRVNIRQRYEIRFDDRVKKARELMLQYIDDVFSRVEGNDAKNLRTIVNTAFTINSSGYLSVGKVLTLIALNIKNDLWEQAVTILKDSMTPQKGKQYLQVETRKSTQFDWQMLRLDIADCWPSYEHAKD